MIETVWIREGILGAITQKVKTVFHLVWEGIRPQNKGTSTSEVRKLLRN